MARWIDLNPDEQKHYLRKYRIRAALSASAAITLTALIELKCFPTPITLSILAVICAISTIVSLAHLDVP